MPAFAYIGPGMSGGVIAAIIGFFVAIFLGLWGILYYPIKRALKRRKETKWHQVNLLMILNEPFNNVLELCFFC